MIKIKIKIKIYINIPLVGIEIWRPNSHEAIKRSPVSECMRGDLRNIGGLSSINAFSSSISYCWRTGAREWNVVVGVPAGVECFAIMNFTQFF